MKIRTRFTLLFAIIVGIILSFFSYSIYYLSENYRKRDFQSRLQDRGIAKLKSVTTYKSQKENNAPVVEEEQFSSINNENFVIYDSQNNVIFKDTTDSIPSRELIGTVIPGKPYFISLKEKECVVFYYSYNGATYLIFSSGYDKHGMSYIANLRQVLLFRGFIILLIIFVSGWLYAGSFLKPISKIVNQASQITYSNLNHRLVAGKSNDEIGKLIHTFNKMLERLETSFNSQKRFVSNASHELRNPLTAINGQIDVALMKERKAEEYKIVLENISKDIKNLRTLTNNLLELANNDETLVQHFEDIRIDEILWGIRDEIARINSDYNIHLHFDNRLDNGAFLVCKGDRKLLETAFINIIDNACKFSSDKKVEIKITFEQNNIILFFTDNGIGMPESYLQHVFEPFYRGNNVIGIYGNGIGLSLVKRIIKLHSGKIFIRSKENEGTIVEIVLPNLS